MTQLVFLTGLVHTCQVLISFMMRGRRWDGVTEPRLSAIVSQDLLTACSSNELVTNMCLICSCAGMYGHSVFQFSLEMILSTCYCDKLPVKCHNVAPTLSLSLFASAVLCFFFACFNPLCKPSIQKIFHIFWRHIKCFTYWLVENCHHCALTKVVFVLQRFLIYLFTNSPFEYFSPTFTRCTFMHTYLQKNR